MYIFIVKFLDLDYRIVQDLELRMTKDNLYFKSLSMKISPILINNRIYSTHSQILIAIEIRLTILDFVRKKKIEIVLINHNFMKNR